MAEQLDLVAVGNAVVDIMCRCEDAFLEQVGVPKGHMVVAPSTQTITRIFRRLPRRFEVAGGSAANVAVGIASLGGHAAFVGRTAADDFGRTFSHDIRGAGVWYDTPPGGDAGKQTSRSLILVTPDGKRTMLTYLGCSTDLELGPRDAATIKSSRIVYLEGYLFDGVLAAKAFQRAASLASSAGRRLCFCLPDRFCVNRHRAKFFRLIRNGVDVLFANEDEIRSLYETSSFDEAVRRVGKDTNLAILTRSEQGAVIVSKGVPIAAPAERQRKLVDATGAGDMFAAGFLFALLRGADLQTAARLGSFAAAEIISFMGARPEVRLSHLARLRGLADEMVA